MFVEMYAGNVALNKFADELKINIAPDAAVRDSPVSGDLDLEDVLSSAFFFS